MGAVDDLRYVGETFARRARDRTSDDVTRMAAHMSGEDDPAAVAAQAALTAFQAAHLAATPTTASEIDAVLGDLHEEVAAAGLAEAAVQMQPAELLRLVLEAVIDAGRQTEMVRALQEAARVMADRLEDLRRNFAAGASTAGPASPAGRQHAAVSQTLDEARAIVAPFMTAEDEEADGDENVSNAA